LESLGSAGIPGGLGAIKLPVSALTPEDQTLLKKLTEKATVEVLSEEDKQALMMLDAKRALTAPGAALSAGEEAKFKELSERDKRGGEVDITRLTTAQQESFKALTEKLQAPTAVPAGGMTTEIQSNVTNLSTEKINVVQRTSPEMTALLGKIDTLMTKLETTAATEATAATNVIEAMKRMQIKLSIDGRELRKTVQTAVKEM
jgi:hypothetical protein